MQKNHISNDADAARAGAAAFDVSGLTNRLECVDEVLGALYLMTESIEDNGRKRSFQRVIMVAEEELAYATGFVESDARRLRAAAQLMREANRTVKAPLTAVAGKRGGRDPLIAAIAAYRKGETAYEMIKEEEWDVHGGEQAVADKTFGGPMRILGGWSKPAVSREGAIAALRFAHEENQLHCCSPAAKAMVAAALAFLDTEAT